MAFDRDQKSPFFKRIKRLGTANPDRNFETITQATFVEGLLQHISKQPKIDRDLLLRRKRIPDPTRKELDETVLRAMFVHEKDFELASYFDACFRAVRDRWPDAWETRAPGYVLNRTNGFRALARFFRPAFQHASDKSKSDFGYESFSRLFQAVELSSQDFNTDTFLPGTSGESELYRRFYSSLQPGLI